MRLERFRKRSAEGDRWTFGERKFPGNDALYDFLPAPEGLPETVKTVWIKRGYGLWPGYILRQLGHRAPNIPQNQLDLFKSNIAQRLIAEDVENFKKLRDQNPNKSAFYLLKGDNERRLESREAESRRYLAERLPIDQVSSVYGEISSRIQNSSANFVSACKRTKGERDAIETNIINQVIVLAENLHAVNKRLSIGPDIMGLPDLSNANRA